MKKGNLLIGQSGGPTAVINATLAGILDYFGAHNNGKLLGLRGGLEGLLAGPEPLDLGQLSPDDLARLSRTGGAALESGRYKPSREDLLIALDYLKQNQVHYFIFTGGNGSMNTPLALSKLAEEVGYELYAIGAPKTVDNDLFGTDHAPGYSSAARWWGQHILDAGLDLYTMRGFDQVKVVETMGRHAGWLAASAVLARFQPGDPPHIILLPEKTFDEANFLARVEEIYRQKGCVLVVAAEGVRDKTGKYLAERGWGGEIGKDPTGQPLLSFGEGVAGFLCALIKDKLGLKTRYDKPGTLQRTSACVSPVDRQEAFDLGREAARYALAGQTRIMPGLNRLGNNPYRTEIIAVALEEVIGREKLLPAEFLTGEGLNEELFKNYLQPLIGPPLMQPYRFF